ncbi:MAG: pyridoxamine 5'-phosphate oxidase [Burkholderiales bacterium]|nr:pyridoxamine 5'-phosphate oxidase [Burkholderiales bacterium]
MDLLALNQKILTKRRQYGDREFLESTMAENPFIQFASWFEDVLSIDDLDPCAMVLSTIDESGFPDSRVVLLLGLKDNKFIFYTSYASVKAQQMLNNNKVAVNFYWAELSRQVRIQGVVEKITPQENQLYFATRDRGGQLAAYSVIQSSPIKDRDSLVQQYKIAEEAFQNQEITCPENWGGYAITPVKYEFFQGRNSRLHDRMVYSLVNGKWQIQRIAP